MSNPPKILLFYRNFYPLTGGIETALVEIFSRLAAQGWLANAITRQKAGMSARAEVRGINVFRYKNIIYSTPLILYFLNLQKYDFIYFNNFEIIPGLFVYPYIILLRLLGKKSFKVVYSSQGLLNINKESYVGFKMTLKRVIDNTVGVFLINATVDRIFAVSEHEKQRIIEAGIKPEIVEVIHNGVNDEAFTYSEDELTHSFKKEVSELGDYIVQLGRIDRVKNYDAAISALPYIRKDIQYVIMGPDQDEEYKKELYDLAARLGVSDRLKFIGPKYGSDKFFILKQSKALIHLSRAEGFCLSVLEGMSQGCICVVSKHPSLTEMVAEGVRGYAFEYGDSRAIAECVNNIIATEFTPNNQSMHENSISYASNYTWSRIAEQTANSLFILGRNK